MKAPLPTLSLKAMFVLVLLVGLASFALASHSLAFAVVLMLSVAVSLVLIAAYSVWARKPLLLSLVVLSVGYFVLADGGIFPGAEQYLPTELALERCSRAHTALDSGKRRPQSLTQWAWEMCSNPNYKDWSYVYWKQYATAKPHQPPNPPSETIDANASDDSVLDSLLDIVDMGDAPLDLNQLGRGTIRLPLIKTTPVVTVIVSRHRDLPQNRAFFISGHCLAVLSTLAIVMLWRVQASKRTKVRSLQQ